MKRYTSSVIIVFLFFLPFFSKSQSFTALDEEDIIQSLSLLGINIFKFPLSSQDSNSFFTYFIEEYENGKLISTIDPFEKNKNLSASMLSFIFPKVSMKEQFAKLYCHSLSDSIEHLNLKYEKMNHDLKLKKKPQCRYNWKEIPASTFKSNASVPLLILFTPHREKFVSGIEIQRACLPGFNPSELGAYFEHYFLIYFKLRTSM